MVGLFWWLEEFAGLGDILMGHFVYKDQDCFRGLAGFLGDGVGHAFADFFFLFFRKCSGDSDADVWHGVLPVDSVCFSGVAAELKVYTQFHPRPKGILRQVRLKW
jgi:hypothetical protein